MIYLIVYIIGCIASFYLNVYECKTDCGGVSLRDLTLILLLSTFSWIAFLILLFVSNNMKFLDKKLF